MNINEASDHFSTGEIVFLARPTTTDAFRFTTAPVLVMLVKRDAIGLNIFNEGFFSIQEILRYIQCMDLRNSNNIG